MANYGKKKKFNIDDDEKFKEMGEELKRLARRKDSILERKGTKYQDPYAYPKGTQSKGGKGYKQGE